MIHLAGHVLHILHWRKVLGLRSIAVHLFPCLQTGTVKERVHELLVETDDPPSVSSQ